MTAPGAVACGWCDGTGSVFGPTGEVDQDGCPVRNATGCDICGGSGQVTPMSTLRAALTGQARLRDLVPLPTAGIVITICYGCAGSKTEPDGKTPCRRCGGTGIDPNPN